MNYRNVIYQLGMLLLVISAFQLAVGVWSLLRIAFGIEVVISAMAAMLISGAGAGFGGLTLCLFTFRKRSKQIGRREAILLVALSWIVGGIAAAMPFFFWGMLESAHQPAHPFTSFVNCFFESVSGLTTAGSSVLTDIEAVPMTLLFWRALIQWIGGIGIVVVFVAVFPSLGVGAKKLYRFETSGIGKQGLMPTIRDSARILVFLYIGLTAVQALLLWLFGMPPIEAVSHAFTTLATGGYSTRNTSVGDFDSLAIELICVLFMILGAVNFSLYYHVLRRRPMRLLRDREFQVFIALVAIGTLIIAISVTDTEIVTSTGERIHAEFGEALRYALFNLVSVQTTTGYATADYDQWPILAKATMFFLILIGGSAGSTAGGLKVVRLIIVAKVLYTMLEKAFRPGVVRPIRIAGTTLDDDVKLNVLGYVLLTIIVLALGSFAVLLLEPSNDVDLTTAVSANLATFCTTGPGFGLVGPASNFGWMTAGSKLVLCTVMVLGRLELFAVLVLFRPMFWRSD